MGAGHLFGGYDFPKPMKVKGSGLGAPPNKIGSAAGSGASYKILD